MKKTFCLDTNVFLYDPNALFSFEENDVVIPFKVLEEIDSKKTLNDEVGFNARQTNRILDDLRTTGDLNKGIPLDNGGTLRIVTGSANIFGMPEELENKADNFIISTAQKLQKELHPSPVFLISKDISMRIKCDILGVPCQDYKKHRVAPDAERVYGGIRVVEVSDDTVDEFFQNRELPVEALSEDYDYDFYPNEFIVIKGPNSSSGLARFMSGKLVKITEWKDVWGLRAKNKEQQFALDVLMDDNIKLTTLIGKAGTGKTLLAVAAGVKQVLEEKKYNKLIVTRPIQPVGKDIGYLPGTKEEKMEPWIQPIMDNLEFLFGCSSKAVNLEMYFSSGQIEVEAITYIRGRSIPNAFIIVDEAQNLSVDEVKTIITRAGQGTKIILTGDIDQIDNNLIDAVSNGLTYTVEKFKEYDIAGHITLIKGERSELSKLAAKIM